MAAITGASSGLGVVFARKLAATLSWERMAGRYLSLYDDVVSGRRSQAQPVRDADPAISDASTMTVAS